MTKQSPKIAAASDEDVVPATDAEIEAALILLDGISFEDQRSEDFAYIARSLIARIRVEQEARAAMFQSYDIAQKGRDAAIEALEPFAKSGRGIGTIYADEFPIDSNRFSHVTSLLTVGDFRRAALPPKPTPSTKTGQ